MRKLWFILLSIIIFQSCSSIEHLSIDYMVPANINFPESLRRVAVVNNINNPAQSTSVSKDNNKPTTTSNKTQTYHGDAALMMESLAQSLAEANYFDEVVVCDSALRATDIWIRENGLSQTETKELTHLLDVDFIIAINNLSLQSRSEERRVGKEC